MLADILVIRPVGHSNAINFSFETVKIRRLYRLCTRNLNNEVINNPVLVNRL